MSATTETSALLEDAPAPASSPARVRTTRQANADLARHTRKCAICNHPNREQIEDDFLRWRDPWTITHWYKLPSRSSLYRHVEAFGLLALRRRNLRGVAERILERIEEVTLKGNNIFQAMRLFAHITEDGQWLEPPKHTIVTHIHTYADSPETAHASPTCHPEPSAPPLRDGGEGPAVHVVESIVACDEPVGPALRRPPFTSVLIGTPTSGRGAASD